MRDWVAAPGSPRVLIVDDEPSICAALTSVLRRAGYDPLTAQGTAEAEPLLSPSIEALLLDLRLPHMRGDAFYYTASARCPQLRRRTLFITGDISTDGERIINQTGCPVLWKPFPSAELLDALRILLGDRTPAPVVPAVPATGARATSS